MRGENSILGSIISREMLLIAGATLMTSLSYMDAKNENRVMPTNLQLILTAIALGGLSILVKNFFQDRDNPNNPNNNVQGNNPNQPQVNPIGNQAEQVQAMEFATGQEEGSGVAPAA